MNKKCFLAAAVLAVAGPVCAQDANTVNSDGYTDWRSRDRCARRTPTP